MTASGYGTEYTWQIRSVSYSPVDDEDQEYVFDMSCGMPVACVSLPSTVSRFQHHGGLLPKHM